MSGLKSLRENSRIWEARGAHRRSLHYATPDFLWNLVALVHFMRPSLRKGAHAAVSSDAWQEIRVRSGRDDNLSGNAKYGFQDELSSRPERSVVEGSAVRPSGFPNSGVLTQTLNLPAGRLLALRVTHWTGFKNEGMDVSVVIAAA